MNGNGNPTTKDNQQPAAPSTTLQIVITWDQVTGQANVNGFLVNKVIFYGMLELAKKIAEDFWEQHEKSSGIVIPVPNLRM